MGVERPVIQLNCCPGHNSSPSQWHKVHLVSSTSVDVVIGQRVLVIIT